MQLEAMMKQRFSWMALLLLTACLVRSSLAGKFADVCGKSADGNGIVETFSHKSEISLTITPKDYEKGLTVTISKKPEPEAKDHSIKIYMLLSEDSNCKKGKIDIVNPNAKDTVKKCTIEYDIKGKKIQFKGTPIILYYTDPYQVLFELRNVTGNSNVSVVALTSSTDEIVLDTGKDCLQKEVDGSIKFDLTFGSEFGTVNCEDGSGAQFEMKGPYEVKKVMIDNEGKDCEVNISNYRNAIDFGSTDATAQTTTESFPMWAYYAIGGGVILFIIIVIVVVSVVYSYFVAKKANTENVEAALNEESRAGQSRAEESKVEQSRDEQSRADSAQQSPDGNAKQSRADSVQQSPDGNAEKSRADSAQQSPDGDAKQSKAEQSSSNSTQQSPDSDAEDKPEDE